VVADAWTLNGRACLLKHLPAYFRSGTPIYTHTPEEVDPIADLDEVRTADLKEVMKTLSAENSIKDWLIEPGPNLLSKIKEFNSSEPYLYDCHTFVKNRALSYMNTADGEIFDPVGKSLSSTSATHLRLVNAFRRI